VSEMSTPQRIVWNKVRERFRTNRGGNHPLFFCVTYARWGIWEANAISQSYGIGALKNSLPLRNKSAFGGINGEGNKKQRREAKTKQKGQRCQKNHPAYYLHVRSGFRRKPIVFSSSSSITLCLSVDKRLRIGCCQRRPDPSRCVRPTSRESALPSTFSADSKRSLS
jgi:hypothetical protein